MTILTDSPHPEVETAKVLNAGSVRRDRHPPVLNHDLRTGADRFVFAVRTFSAVCGAGRAGAVDDLFVG